MNKEHEKMPSKIKVRTRRTSENSCVSAHGQIAEKSPDLLEDVLPAALDYETEGKMSEKKEEPIKFISVDTAEEPALFMEEDMQDTVIEKAAEETERKTKPHLFTPFSEMSFVRKVIAVIISAFCLWSLLPAVVGIIGIGLFAPLAIGLFALFTVTAWDYIASVKNRLWKLMWFIVAVVAMAGAVAFAFVSGHMIAASNNTAPANNSNITVVVLGCKVNGTAPSKMLKVRLDTAADYLLTHPGVNCIVAGGMGGDEVLPEAVVMKKYLVEKGVSASRIKVDDKSTSTMQNLENAIDVANSNNYYTTFYIVTDRFHQYRASIMCKELGVTSYALSCETPWYLTMNYWFREMFAIAHYTVTKN